MIFENCQFFSLKILTCNARGTPPPSLHLSLQPFHSNIPRWNLAWVSTCLCYFVLLHAGSWIQLWSTQYENSTRLNKISCFFRNTYATNWQNMLRALVWSNAWKKWTFFISCSFSYLIQSAKKTAVLSIDPLYLLSRIFLLNLLGN